MVTIRDIRTIVTAPNKLNLIVVKVETSEPGLYGLGCATFAYRHLAVQSIVNDYLKPLLVGRDVSRRHLAALQLQQLLAQRSGHQQRHLRRRHGAVGYQG